MLEFLCGQLFPAVVNMSLTGGIMILVVLLFRLALRRAPKVFSYALWSVVLFRLLCPVSFSWAFSLLSLVDPPTRQTTALSSSVEYVSPDRAETVLIPGDPAPVTGEQAAPPARSGAPTAEEVLALVWLAGGMALAAYSLISLFRLRRRLAEAVLLRDNLYEADHIGTPFVLGIFRPKIYLPSALGEGERQYIILHEQCHIRRRDHIVKVFAFAALCVHWFNPLVWAAFLFSGKDMEMSCDEAVVRRLGEGIRADYSASLLSLTAGRRIAGAPLAFGEGDTKARIRNLLRWKKPRLWLSLAAAAVCVAVIAACGANPLGNGGENGSGMETLTGGYASMEDYASQTVKTGDTIPYFSADGSAAETRVTGVKLDRLEKLCEVNDLAPDGVLEAWAYRNWVQVEAEPADILLAGGMEESDGWYDLEGQGGHYAVALRYADGSYDVLYDATVGDGLDFLGYRESYEAAVYDWYVQDQGLDLPLVQSELIISGTPCPALRFDGDGWYLYIPADGRWGRAGDTYRWDSLYATGASFVVNPCDDRMEDVRASYGQMGCWPYDTELEPPMDYYYQLNPLGGGTDTRLFFIPESEQSSYVLECTLIEGSPRPEEEEIIYAILSSFTLDSRVTGKTAEAQTTLAMAGVLDGLTLENCALIWESSGAAVPVSRELVEAIRSAVPGLSASDGVSPADYPSQTAGLRLTWGGEGSIRILPGFQPWNVLLSYTDGDRTENAVVDNFRLYLLACMDETGDSVELHDLDEDGLLEVLLWQNKDNRSQLIVYDTYDGVVQRDDIDALMKDMVFVNDDQVIFIEDALANYTGHIGNIRLEYANLLEATDQEGNVHLFRYDNGTISYVCPLSEALQ